MHPSQVEAVIGSAFDGARVPARLPAVPGTVPSLNASVLRCRAASRKNGPEGLALVLPVVQGGPSVLVRRYHDGGLALQVDDQILRVPQGVRANPDPTIGWPGQVDR